MKDQDNYIFISLFKEACEKCFGFPLTSPLSEADSKLLSNEIFSHTGLVIGAKSIKNYSFYVSGRNIDKTRKENPSVATLDTLARYVLEAPYTGEIQRKNNESHYPYWFQYRNRFSFTKSKRKDIQETWSRTGIFSLISIIIILLGFFLIKSLTQKNRNDDFTDNFDSVREDSLKSRGWFIKSVDTTWWNHRADFPGHLTLFTLKGDNWGNSEHPAGIRNLIMRKVSTNCFIVEIHLTKFNPGHNWQQAGILLSEDSTFNGKMVRLSISYNDYFGGYVKPPEIIIQAVSSSESGRMSKPEEIAHLTLFNIEAGKESLVESNLAKSALKIEKKGTHFRFLYTTSPMESFTFKEVVSGNFDIVPGYVSIFSIQGWSVTDNIIPTCFDSFKLAGIRCDK